MGGNLHPEKKLRRLSTMHSRTQTTATVHYTLPEELALKTNPYYPSLISMSHAIPAVPYPRTAATYPKNFLLPLLLRLKNDYSNSQYLLVQCSAGCENSWKISIV